MNSRTSSPNTNGVGSGSPSLDSKYPYEKYPPRPNDLTPSSAVHIPLLSSEDDSLNSDETSTDYRDRTPLFSPQAGLFQSRTRLHPLTLFPAFILGIVLAMSGLFGTSTFWRKPPEFIKDSYSIGPGNDVRLTSDPVEFKLTILIFFRDRFECQQCGRITPFILLVNSTYILPL